MFVDVVVVVVESEVIVLLVCRRSLCMWKWTDLG